jgi:Abnormal spindle-like microcephaly-assoc'd, ASPM-SPD-2-Hydin
VHRLKILSAATRPFPVLVQLSKDRVRPLMRKTPLVCVCVIFSLVLLTLASIPARAAAELSTNSIQFGSVDLNSSSSPAKVTITNDGRRSLTIEHIWVSSPDFEVTGISLPLTLSPNSATSFSVIFHPTAAQSYTGYIHVACESRYRGGDTIVVTGTGVSSGGGQGGSQLSPSPSTLSFGSAAVGKTMTQSISVTNMGKENVTVSQVAASGTGFSVSGFSGTTTLSAGQSLSLPVSFSPTQPGSMTGSLKITSNATNSPTMIPLSGTGVESQLSVSPSSVNFGSVTTGKTSSQTVTISNSGTASLTITSVAVSGTGFSDPPTTLPLTIPAGSSSTLPISFAPTAAGPFAGTLTLVNNSATPSVTVALSGTGTTAQTLQLSASPTSLSFGSIAAGTSATKTVTLTNTGTGSVLLSNDSVTGTGFTVSGMSMPMTLSAGQSTSFNVAFAPTASGSFSGAVSVTSNATNSPATIALSGSGVQSAIAISPASVSFGSLNTGQTSNQTVTISNSGTASLTITSASVSGTGFKDSGIALPLAIPAGSSSAFTVSFEPTTAGTFAGTLTLVNNSATPSVTVALSGTGTTAQTLQLSASPTSLSFGSVAAGTSTTKTVTLTNTGTGSVSLLNDGVTGSGFTVSGMSMPMTLSAGQSTSFNVAFAPTASGSFSGNVTVTSNATNSPATIALSGTGVQSQISVTPAAVSFGNVTTGVTNTQTVTISNPGSASLTVSSAALSGTGFGDSGLSTPLTIAAGGSSTFTVSFAPTTAGAVTGSLTLVNNSTTPSATIALSGTGVAQTLQVAASPTAVSFGSVTTGTSSTQTVTLTNSGNASVSLSKDSVAGTGFSVSGLALPLTLSAGQSTSFSVVFDPTTAGSASGSVTITSNATNSPTTIALSGTGASSTNFQVTLNWSPSSSTYSGFNAYRSTVSGGPYTKLDSALIASPSFTDSTVTSGQTYYYVVTEVSSSGVESAYSSQTSVSIP